MSEEEELLTDNEKRIIQYVENYKRKDNKVFSNPQTGAP